MLGHKLVSMEVVSLQAVFAFTMVGAILAHIKLLSVYMHVPLQQVFRGSRILAMRTRIGFLLRVGQNVSLEVGLGRSRVGTPVTGKGLLPRVSAQVCREVALNHGGIGAVRAMVYLGRWGEVRGGCSGCSSSSSSPHQTVAPQDHLLRMSVFITLVQNLTDSPIIEYLLFND